MFYNNNDIHEKPLNPYLQKFLNDNRITTILVNFSFLL